MKVRAARPDDAEAIAAIYAPYVEQSAISFELEAPGPEAIAERMAEAGGLYPWLVAEDERGTTLGYAYAGAFRTRAAYRWVVETSVYVAADAHGRGFGSGLYRPLLRLLEAQGFTQAMAAIALPNEDSVRVHERCGFVHAGTYKQSGYKLGRWWDVGIWQRPLATASAVPPEPRPWREVASADSPF